MGISELSLVKLPILNIFGFALTVATLARMNQHYYTRPFDQCFLWRRGKTSNTLASLDFL